MTLLKHGLSIGIERVEKDFFLSLKTIGKLTHKDYQVITPMINAALDSVKEPKINALIDTTELEGWELRAAWDDFKLGLTHGCEFDKIAVYGNRNWQKISSKISSWFISGELEYFDNLQAALIWLHE